MSDDPSQGWDVAAERAAAALPAASGGLVVLGRDTEETAQAALALARALARTRQVALADLLGDSATLTALVDDPLAPGIADSFGHGVSLNRVARAVPREERLFILPSGGDAAAAPGVRSSPRWERLARGFRDANALLVVVTRADGADAEGLARRLGGAIVVGLDVVLGADVRTWATMLRAPAPAVDTPDAPGEAVESAAPSGSLRSHRAVLIGVAAVLVGGVTLILQRARSGAATRADSAVATPRIAAPIDTPPLDTSALIVSDPGDSTRAAAFSVELLAANTLDGAMIALRDSVSSGTVAPALLGAARSRWFRVVAGAYVTRREADSLLADLVRRGRAVEGSARVIRAPLAFRLEAGLARDTTPLALARWRRAGLPAYGLVQEDGHVTIFMGAFERSEQGALLVPALQSAGVIADLAYRTGRTF